MPVEGKYANADELLDNLTYAGLDLDRSILVGAVPCMVNSVKIDMEARSGVPQLVVGLTTEAVCKDNKGEDVQAGWKTFWRSNLMAHPNVAPDKAEMATRINREEQARFMCAALGTKYDKASPPSLKPTEQYVGRSLVVDFKAREQRDKGSSVGNGKFAQEVKRFAAVNGSNP